MGRGKQQGTETATGGEPPGLAVGGQLAGALDAMLEGYQIVDRDFRYVYLNKTALEHGRATREALIGKTMMECYPGIEATEMFAKLRTCLNERQPQEMLNEFTFPDGGRGWFELRMRPVPAGAAVLSIDVTARETGVRDREALQARLYSAERLEALGRLAGGVAHDFNNILTVVGMGLDWLKTSIADDHPHGQEIERIRREVERGARLTRQLLALGRRQVSQPRLLDVNRTIRDLAAMLERLIDARITLHLDLSPDVQAVKIDPGQFEQILMNLALNARDAMPGGGELAIRSEPIVLDQHYKETHGLGEPGPHVLIVVRDNGTGMDAQTRERIFEPFFSTKGDGRGHGMGLATVYGIVRQAGGIIWVYSEPGEGTTFKIYLPAADGDRPYEAAQPPAGADSQRIGRVLVVED